MSPVPSTAAALPDAARDQLEALIHKFGFRNYDEMHKAALAAGFEISRSSLARHGQRLRKRQEQLRAASEAARQLVEATGDDHGVMAEAAMRLAQERIFDVLLAAETRDAGELAQVARSLADTARAGTRLREERRKWRADAAAKAERAARSEGISEAVADKIRAAVEGR